LQFGAEKTRRKGHDHRMARGLATAWDHRTVIGVVADLPGWVEYLPRRRAGQDGRIAAVYLFFDKLP
jgi:hypothetical protein